MHTMIVQCSPDDGLMNINISQCEKAFSCLEVILGTFYNLADYYTVCFGVIFVSGPLLGKVTVVLNITIVNVNLWSPNCLEMVL